MLNALRAGALAVLASSLVAGAASAAPSFVLVWNGTTGTGAIGSDTIAAGPGDTLTLDVLIEVDADGLSGWDFDLLGSGVTAVSGVECPPGDDIGPFGFRVGCQTTEPFFQIIQPVDPGVIIDGSNIRDYDGGTLSPISAQTVPFYVGRGVFTVNGPGEVGIGAAEGGFNLSDGTLSALFDTATATIVPEPGTFSLLAPGLAALAFRRRRG